MLECPPGTVSFGHMDVFQDRIELSGVDRMKSATFSFDRKRTGNGGGDASGVTRSGSGRVGGAEGAAGSPAPAAAAAAQAVAATAASAGVRGEEEAGELRRPGAIMQPLSGNEQPPPPGAKGGATGGKQQQQQQAAAPARVSSL